MHNSHISNYRAWINQHDWCDNVAIILNQDKTTFHVLDLDTNEKLETKSDLMAWAGY